MDKLTALLAGLLFGAGLTLSGMVNPMKVQNFMDIFGRWDPTLLFVMAAALAVTYAGYQLVLKAPRPRFALAFIMPSLQGDRRAADRRRGGLRPRLGPHRLLPRPRHRLAGLRLLALGAVRLAMAAGMAIARHLFLATDESPSADG